ncbi:hypothetical protein BsWGS_14025 [Bradybaena similaris]
MARICIAAFLMSLAAFATWAEERCTDHGIDSNDYKFEKQYILGAIRVISVRVVQQNSKSACTENVSFGFTGPDVWVDHGCRAVFNVCFETGYNQVVRCESQNYQTRTCSTNGYIKLLTVKNQLSKAACTEGVSFFKSDMSIIVTNGCRADFNAGF